MTHSCFFLVNALVIQSLFNEPNLRTNGTLNYTGNKCNLPKSRDVPGLEAVIDCIITNDAADAEMGIYRRYIESMKFDNNSFPNTHKHQNQKNMSHFFLK